MHMTGISSHFSTLVGYCDKTNLVSYTCVYMNTAVLSEYIVLTVKHSIRKRAIGKTMGAYMFALP